MEKAIIGKKIGMTQIFDADGKVIPVTVIEAGPCTVVQKKTEEKDGYNAVQLGYGDVAERKLTKPELGHLKKAGDARKKTLKEFKLAKAAEMNVGDEVKVDVFAEGDRVDVTGISKGHGYQGVIKRHGAHRLKETHGSGPVVRHAGSMGANSDPSRIFKGKIGAGQMGNEQVTVLNLDVVKVDAETGKQVPLPVSFQLEDASGNLVTYTSHYPVTETIDTWTANARGELTLPMLLEEGDYTLKEVQAPCGYVKELEGKTFHVGDGYNGWENPLVIEFSNMPRRLPSRRQDRLLDRERPWTSPSTS